jgi:transposase-like protein
LKKFSPEQKVNIYQEYLRCQNKSKVSRQFNIDRSYLYEIISECESVLLDHFKHKEPGRKKADTPKNYAEALEKVKDLKKQNLQLEKDNEYLYVEKEWLNLRLSFTESEKKPHLKKTKKKRS